MALPELDKGLLHEVFSLIHVAFGQPASIVAKWRVPAPENGIESGLLSALQGLRQIVFVLILQRLRVLLRLKTPNVPVYPDAGCFF